MAQVGLPREDDAASLPESAVASVSVAERVAEIETRAETAVPQPGRQDRREIP